MEYGTWKYWPDSDPGFIGLLVTSAASVPIVLGERQLDERVQRASGCFDETVGSAQQVCSSRFGASKH